MLLTLRDEVSHRDWAVSKEIHIVVDHFWRDFEPLHQEQVELATVFGREVTGEDGQQSERDVDKNGKKAPQMLFGKAKMGKFVLLAHLVDRVVKLVFVSSGYALVISFRRDLVDVEITDSAGFFTCFTVC